MANRDVYCILDTHITSDQLPVDICRGRDDAAVTVRVAGLRLNGPLGNHPEAFDLLKRERRDDLIAEYSIRRF